MHANPVPQTDPQLARTPRTVTVNASLYRTSHGREPHGHGWWTFDFYAGGECRERHWRYGGEYALALTAVQAHAERIGAFGVELLP